MKEVILLIIAAILLVAFVIISIRHYDKKNKEAKEKEMLELLKQWPEIKRKKYLDVAGFSKNVLLLKEYFLPSTGGVFWKEQPFRGRYFQMSFFNEERFYPSTRTFGSLYAPSYYIENEKEAEVYYIGILERFGDYMYSVHIEHLILNI